MHSLIRVAFVLPYKMKDMEDNTDKNRMVSNAMIYATYTILYMNDLACHCANDLSIYVKDKDKESRKIFGALQKRYTHYFREIRKIVTDQNNFLSIYDDYMDKVNDSDLIHYRKAISYVLKCNGIDDYEYLAAVETARSMIELSTVVVDNVTYSLKKAGINPMSLKTYRLNELLRVANNFADWAYRKIPKEKHIVLNDKKSIMKYFSKINNNILDYENFVKCYESAIKEEKENEG